MNRYKFRVWDDKLKIFKYFDIFNSFGNIPKDCRENIQQFTGLKDSAGREIYEGDIIETYVDDEVIPNLQNYQYRLIVFWDNKGFWSAKQKMDEYTGPSFPFYGDHYEILLNKTKIIGNIFDNPELLLKTK